MNVRLRLRRYYFLPRRKRQLQALKRLGAPIVPTFWFSENGDSSWITIRFFLFLVTIIITGGYVGTVITRFLTNYP